jgi:serine/threonine protein phosphatase PrpC
MEIESAGCTHVGRRGNNEDNMVLRPDLGLFVVADGMGGYEGGEVASRIVVDTLSAFFELNAGDAGATWPFKLDRSMGLAENMVTVGIQLANREVVRRRTGALRAMGSTAAILVVDGQRVVVGHVGDSRVYRLRGRRIDRLTEDHSLVAELRRGGASSLPVEQFGHIITRAVGIGEDVRPEVLTGQALEGDVYLLCSDGLTDPLDDEEIGETLARLPPIGACQALVDQALAEGGTDNITVVVVSVGLQSGSETRP